MYVIDTETSRACRMDCRLQIIEVSHSCSLSGGGGRGVAWGEADTELRHAQYKDCKILRLSILRNLTTICMQFKQYTMTNSRTVL